jgi:DnaK suppressor protein
MALSPEQSGELGRLIDERRNALAAELSESVERARGRQYGELAGPAPDAGDESVADLISDLDHADVTRDLEELRALEAARERMAQGSYGSCVTCGADIEFERLRVNPAALRCVDCQRVYEKTHASTSGSSL